MPSFATVLAFFALSSPPFRVCIDPGHPSEVGIGTTGKKISEVKAAWRVSQKVATLLRDKGIFVQTTKGTELEKVSNKQRAQYANAMGANLMVRLHCDAEGRSGFGVYYPANQGKDGKFVGPSKEIMRRSGEFAKFIEASMKASLKGIHSSRGLMTDRQTAIGAKKGALVGSIHSKVPVVLVEMAVLSNPKDDAWMASEKGQNQMALALCDSIIGALKKLSGPLPKHRVD